jgi:hypothetical protein
MPRKAQIGSRAKSFVFTAKQLRGKRLDEDGYKTKGTKPGTQGGQRKARLKRREECVGFSDLIALSSSMPTRLVSGQLIILDNIILIIEAEKRVSRHFLKCNYLKEVGVKEGLWQEKQ